MCLKKYSIIISLIFVVTCIGSISANIVVFMDNSGSINQYKNIFHDQFEEIFKMAKDKNINIKLVPIGESNSFIYAQDEESAKKIFSFDSSYTCIYDPLNTAKEKEIVSPAANTIVIISDMESDITNTLHSWQLISQDYQDMLNWYKLINEWIIENMNVHILLLNVDNKNTFEANILKKEYIENELNTLIAEAKIQEEYVCGMIENFKPEGRHKKMREIMRKPDYFIRSPDFNKKLIARVVRSLSMASKEKTVNKFKKRSMHYYAVPLDKKDQIMSIMKGIINPELVNVFQVKIELNPNVVNLHRPEQAFVRQYISMQALETICKNPLRKVEYTIANGIQKEHEEAYHYHYRVARGKIPGMMNIYLTNKALNSEGQHQLVKDKLRYEMNIKYADLDDLTLQILQILNNLTVYQEKDFPIGERNILIKLETPKVHLFRGRRLTAYTEGDSVIPGNLSTKLGTDGQCYIKVRKQSNSIIKLEVDLYEEGTLETKELTITTIKADMILGNDPVVIKDISNEFSYRVPLEIEDSELEGQVQIIPFDTSEHFDLYSISFPCNLTEIELLPGSYYYNVLFDYEKNKCLNDWKIPLHIDDSSTKAINVQCTKDLFANENDCITAFDEAIVETEQSLNSNYTLPKLGINELTLDFDNHLTGSPFFFRRLFKYTAEKDPGAQDNFIKDLWRRIHYQLFIADTYSENEIKNVLESALLNLDFTNPEKDKMSQQKNKAKKIPLIKKAHVYLKTIFEIFLNGYYLERLNTEEKGLYNYELLEKLNDDLNLNKQFMDRLYIQ